MSLLCEREEVARVSLTRILFLAQELQALDRVFAHRLKHAEARVLAGLAPNQTLLRDSGEVVQHRCAADRFGRVDAPRADEDSEPGEHPLLLRSQEVEAPLEREPESAMPSRSVARPGCQEVKPSIEPVEHCPRREQSRARRSELDRKRKPFETNAELHHGRFRRIGHGEARGYRFGPLPEKRTGS